MLPMTNCLVSVINNAFIQESKKDERPIPFEDVGKLFSLPLFNGIQGVISQDDENGNHEPENWGKRAWIWRSDLNSIK